MAQGQLVICSPSGVLQSDPRTLANIQSKVGKWRATVTPSALSPAFYQPPGILVSTKIELAKKRSRHVTRCFPSKAAVSAPEDNDINFKPWDPDRSDRVGVGPLLEFKLSDFELCPHVSVGLAGRGDEVLFEGIVRNPESSLKGMRVVLRQLASRRAQRWGQRALQVLSRVVPSENLNLSYTTQVHGYIRASGSPDERTTLTLVHGYHGSYSLHQWLHSEDWLSELETGLSLDSDAARRIGDDRTGGPAVSRQLRLVRMLMRDLLIGVNYLHSRGYAHTELRLQNLQISEADGHVKVGLLGNAAAFPIEIVTPVGANTSRSPQTRQLMIAYDIRCVGFIMAKMALRELMDPSTFALFKSYLAQGHDPAGLREFFMGMVNKGSPSDNIGIQLLDRDGGVGWNLLAFMLAIKPTDRISCKDALRHPFLCGPMWRVMPSIEMTRWSIGSTTVRIVEEYIYGPQQRTKLAKLIDVLERMNPNSSSEGWSKLLGGRWRLLYHTGRQIGLTVRQGSPTVIISSATLNFAKSSESKQGTFSMMAEIGFTAMNAGTWPHDKSGVKGTLKVVSPRVNLSEGERLYIAEEKQVPSQKPLNKLPEAGTGNRNQKRPRHVLPDEPALASLPVVRVFCPDELDMEMDLDQNLLDASFPMKALRELRLQLPKEMFDLTGLVCATYIDSRLMVLRGVSGSACLFTRSPLISLSETLN